MGIGLLGGWVSRKSFEDCTSSSQVDIGLLVGWVLRNSLEDSTTSSYVVSKVMTVPSLFNSAFGVGNSSVNSILVSANSSMTDIFILFSILLNFVLNLFPY